MVLSGIHGNIAVFGVGEESALPFTILAVRAALALFAPLPTNQPRVLNVIPTSMESRFRVRKVLLQ